MSLENPEKNRLRDIIAKKSLLTSGNFTLASGHKSNTFFDMKKTMLDPEGATLLTDTLWKEIKNHKLDCIGGLEMGAVPIVSQLSLRSYPEKPVPSFFVRKKAKGHGTDQKVDGYLHAGNTAIVFEDVTTTGGSALQAVEAVRKNGAFVETVITVVDRLAGAEHTLSAEGLTLISLFTMNDFDLGTH